MTEMFNQYDNIASDYIPHNIKKCLCDCGTGYYDQVIRGANSELAFILPFSISQELKNINLLIFQGIEEKLNYSKENLNIIEEQVDDEGYEFNSNIMCYLTAQDTSKLNTYNDETFCQFKMILTNDDVIYSRKYKIKIVSTLDNQEGVKENV